MHHHERFLPVGEAETGMEVRPAGALVEGPGAGVGNFGGEEDTGIWLNLQDGVQQAAADAVALPLRVHGEIGEDPSPL